MGLHVFQSLDGKNNYPHFCAIPGDAHDPVNFELETKGDGAVAGDVCY